MIYLGAALLWTLAFLAWLIFWLTVARVMQVIADGLTGNVIRED